MQIRSSLSTAIRSMPISLDPAFPIHAPYLDRLHYSRSHPADYMHYHESWEIGICMQGSGIFYMGNEVHRYSAMDVSVIAPGVVHIAQSDPESISGWQFLDIGLEGMLAGLPPEYMGAAGLTFCGIVRPDELPSLMPLVRFILDELNARADFCQELVRLKVAEMALLLRRMDAGGMQPSLTQGVLSEISPALLYIVNHYHEHITLADLAAMCLKSTSSFRRSFVRAMGMSPFEYLYQVRIKAAINLLSSTNLPISQIAERVGYETLSSFNRHFKRIMGISPMMWRKQEKH